MSFFTIIGDTFKAIAAVFGFAKTKTDLNNTPKMEANAEAAQIQADRDKARKDMASEDQEQLNKDVAP